MASQFPQDPPPPPYPPAPPPPPTPPPSTEPNPLIERVRRILLEPRAEWPRIDAEPATVSGIVTGYVLPLAAIGPVASLIGGLVFGYGAFGFVYRPSFATLLTTAVISYLIAILCTWVVALVIGALAPSFGGVKNPVQAMKVAAYSATAGWLAGVFQILPSLAILGLLGLYGIYLLWIGLPMLMRVPADKAVAYVIVSIVVSVIMFVIAGALVGAIAGRLTAPTYPRGSLTISSAALPSSMG